MINSHRSTLDTRLTLDKDELVVKVTMQSQWIHMFSPPCYLHYCLISLKI